jgi:hypothetical protein
VKKSAPIRTNLRHPRPILGIAERIQNQNDRQTAVSPRRFIPFFHHSCIPAQPPYNPIPMYVEINLGDIVQLRKKHPCGSDAWQVVRLGADVGLVCRGCGRRILLPRGKFNKQLKQIIKEGEPDDA